MRYAAIAFILVCPAVWAQSSDIAADERVILYPAIGHRINNGQTWSIDAHGWIFEDTWTDASLWLLEQSLDLDDRIEDPAQRKLLRRRLAPFVVDNESGERIELTIGDSRSTAPPSGANGHFRASIELPADQAAAIQSAAGNRRGRLTYQAQTAPKDKRVFAGRVHLLEPQGVSVISDIDDTIRITQVGNRRALLRNTFLLPFQPVPGMAEAYAEWARQYDAEFHCISASPYQLYEPLADFMTASGFPEGTFHLKTIRLKDRTALDLFDSAEDFKPQQIEPLLKLFPHRTFVCVGDSGEKDPEIYGTLARSFPQIRRILIRNVTNEGPDAPRYQRAFRDLPADSWTVFKDPSQVRDLHLPAPTSAPATSQPSTAGSPQK